MKCTMRSPLVAVLLDHRSDPVGGTKSARTAGAASMAGSEAGLLQGCAAADHDSSSVRLRMSPTTRAMGAGESARWLELGMVKGC